MTLENFVTTYFGALKTAEIPFCVLRNHEGLPRVNVGNDLDLLVRREDVGEALRRLAGLSGLLVTDLVERTYVVGAFLFDIDGLGFHVDFVTSLSWKGQVYLEVEEVLMRAATHSESPLVPVPHRVDEAIISFFSSYLIGGFVKERYFPTFAKVFKEDRAAVLEHLHGRLDEALLGRILGLVAVHRFSEALHLLGKLRRSLLLNAFKQSPAGSMRTLFRHYQRESWIRLTPQLLNTVVFLGPDGAGKSAVIVAVQEHLDGVTGRVEYVHLRRRFFFKGRASGGAAVVDPHGQSAKGKPASHLQLGSWLLELWLDRWTLLKRSGVLRLFDRYFYDVLVDPKRYRYGGSALFASKVARWVPKPELVVLLDAAAEVLHARKQEVPLAETARQREAYRRLVEQLPNGRVVDASQPLESVVAAARSLVLEHMTERTRQRLKRDFDV